MNIVSIGLLCMLFLAHGFLVAMHESEEVNVGQQPRVHWMSDSYDDVPVEKSYSVADRWKGYEEAACKSLVESLVMRKLLHCFVSKQQIGSFDGTAKVATTYFEDGYSKKQFYHVFTEELLGDDVDYDDILITIEGSLYDLEGKKRSAGYETKFKKEENRGSRKNRCILW